MRKTRVPLLIVAGAFMAQGCQQAPQSEQPTGPTTVIVETPTYDHFQVVDVTEEGAVEAALRDGWVLVNCSVGVGRGGSSFSYKHTIIREHCYFVREGAPYAEPEAPGDQPESPGAAG